MLDPMSVSAIMDKITSNQGIQIMGPVAAAFDPVVTTVTGMVRRAYMSTKARADSAVDSSSCSCEPPSVEEPSVNLARSAPKLKPDGWEHNPLHRKQSQSTSAGKEIEFEMVAKNTLTAEDNVKTSLASSQALHKYATQHCYSLSLRVVLI